MLGLHTVDVGFRWRHSWTCAFRRVWCLQLRTLNPIVTNVVVVWGSGFREGLKS